ncbi:MAG TPA: hypothetical protein VHZ50_16360 [Puia sp.]|jgi:hypothetical protein|nr:hypothetical protein [Puia sp.]
MSKKVSVQKGPLKLNEPTMKNQSYQQRAMEDHRNDMLRKSMMIEELMTPRQK